MGNSESFSSCSRVDSPSLRALYIENFVNNTDISKNIEIFIFFLKADCYITQVFYPLTVLIIVFGTILNLFSLYCFLKMNKRNSQNVYLSVLSLVDTINLHINFTLPMLRTYEKFDGYFCKWELVYRLTGVLTEFFLIYPTWIVVLLTMERLIFISCPLRRRSSYAQIRAKIFIITLAIIVILLSLYRFFDLKGIDQVSAFTVAACNGTHKSIGIMRNVNLMIWTILPECLTLIMSLIIIYQIKLATKHFDRDHSKACLLKYNQATKTVLLISILFLIFHTPTGMYCKFD